MHSFQYFSYFCSRNQNYLLIMKRLTFIGIFILLVTMLHAQIFETADKAVQNMGIGWNLGNTLDANKNDGSRQGLESETCWGQPYTKPELMKMLKQAGFGIIRVPVTWFPHMDSNGKVDAQWMARVHEVVDYVLDAGMYCLLNVHHDTGEGNFHWLHANMDTYNSVKAKYEYLWQQIAEEFKDYDQRLLFESYNEMLDKYDSWNFATYASPSRYVAADATDAYNAINCYAQSFVNTVRATGGNNAKRNLVVNTYGACNGAGTWNSHLADPVKEMKMPTDPAGMGHIAFQVHTYPNISNLASAKAGINQMFSLLTTHLVSKGGPVIIGEWGTSNANPNVRDYDADREKYLEFVDFFVKTAKAQGFGMIYWMSISDGSARSLPVFSQPDLAEAMIKAYHGSSEGYVYPSRDNVETECIVTYNDNQWAELNLYSGTPLPLSTYKGLRLEMTEAPAAGAFHIKVYGENKKEQYMNVNGLSATVTFNNTLGTNVNRITLQHKLSGSYVAKIRRAILIRQDGREERSAISPFWGCTLVENIVSSINSISISPNPSPTDNTYYDLCGRHVVYPTKGLYIHGGRKVIVR